jgi:hypothetical protein
MLFYFLLTVLGCVIFDFADGLTDPPLTTARFREERRELFDTSAIGWTIINQSATPFPRECARQAAVRDNAHLAETLVCAKSSNRP